MPRPPVAPRLRAPLSRRAAAVVVSACLLAGVPAIAQASFAGWANASLAISTADLASGAVVTASCKGSTYTVNITSWPVPARLVGIFTVTENGTVVHQHRSDGAAAGRTFSGSNPGNKKAVAWTVHNEYPVPNSPNLWAGAPQTGSVAC